VSDESVTVLDAEGRQLSPTTRKKAQQLLAQGRATRAGQDPLVIQLTYAVDLPEPPEEIPPPGRGRRILLHICCGPCATYPLARLREEEFHVTGFWYNPNVHPWQEHERRREGAEQVARAAGLPMVWHAAYEMVPFLRQVVGQEQFGQRCQICYRLRLGRTAQAAAQEGFDAFTTTLLISPHQDQEAIRRIGEEVGKSEDVEFFFENFRRGWSQGQRAAREHGIYRQQYCGCIYSEWERYGQPSQKHVEGPY
jgi:predicted adenine nucleotide alpha hydrolase (AANH) superfamily ATPase